MSSNYAMVSNYYNSGLWSIRQVRHAVIKHYITESEFTQITGLPFQKVDSEDSTIGGGGLGGESLAAITTALNKLI